MTSILADTSALYALSVESDPDHAKANQWLASNRSGLIVTDFIVDELLTLLRFRREHRRALELGRDLFDGRLARVEWVMPTDVLQAWEVFQKFHDKAWSFTDCVSRVVMGRLDITCAFAFDEHFRQFGTVTVVP